jgi:hypothetical protein
MAVGGFFQPWQRLAPPSASDTQRQVSLPPGNGGRRSRVYTVDGGRHFIGSEPLVCANNAEAIDQASAFELWCGELMVLRLEAETNKRVGVLF